MERTLHLSDVVSALSHALDLRGKAPRGHSVRTCLMGMELGKALALPPRELSSLYYALLLKDGGGRSTYHPDDDRMTRGAEIAAALGFNRATANALRHVHERWDGEGGPEGLSGAGIPVLSRIIALAQAMDLALMEGGVREVMELVKAGRGSSFDPELVDRVLGWRYRSDWWMSVRASTLPESLRGLEPTGRVRTLSPLELDRVVEAFAEIIDAKSSFTYDHSRRVAEIARAVGWRMGASASEARLLYRGGLLHDIGKLAVPNRLLNKSGMLGPEEVALVRSHPVHSFEILRRVTAFRDVAPMVAYHHERLDGSGYPWGVAGDQLDQSCRILAVADMYEALSADRPYRAALAPGQVLQILQAEARRGRLDTLAVEAMAAAVDEDGGLLPTNRQADVLLFSRAVQERREGAGHPTGDASSAGGRGNMAASHSPFFASRLPYDHGLPAQGRLGERWGWVRVG